MEDKIINKYIKCKPDGNIIYVLKLEKFGEKIVAEDEYNKFIINDIYKHANKFEKEEFACPFVNIRRAFDFATNFLFPCIMVECKTRSGNTIYVVGSSFEMINRYVICHSLTIKETRYMNIPR